MGAIRGKLLTRRRAANRERATLDRNVGGSLEDGGLGAAHLVLRSAKASRLQRARAHAWIALEDHDSSHLARALSIFSILATLTAITILVIGSWHVGGCGYDTALYDLPNCTGPSQWSPMAIDGEPCHDPRIDGTRAAPGEILLEVAGSREVWSSSSQRRCARSANGARLDDSSEALRITELVCIVLFTTELVFRCLTFSVAVSLSNFILDPINIADIVTVAPWYIELGLANSGNAVDTNFLQVIRTVRLLRISQLLRFASHFQQAGILIIAARRSRVVIGLIFAVATVYSLVLGALMYAAEMGSYVALADFASGGGVVDDSGTTLSIDSASPSCTLDVCGQYVRADRAISPFESIPLAMYWALVTMTTVGYGDMIGLSPAGYAIGSVTIIVGSIFLSLPIAVFSTEFEESSREIKRRQKMASMHGEMSRRQEQLAERITMRTRVNKVLRSLYTPPQRLQSPGRPSEAGSNTDARSLRFQLDSPTEHRRRSRRVQHESSKLRLALAAAAKATTTAKQTSPTHDSVTGTIVESMVGIVHNEHLALKKDIGVYIERRSYELRLHAVTLLAHSNLVMAPPMGDGSVSATLSCDSTSCSVMEHSLREATETNQYGWSADPVVRPDESANSRHPKTDRLRWVTEPITKCG